MSQHAKTLETALDHFGPNHLLPTGPFNCVTAFLSW